MKKSVCVILVSLLSLLLPAQARWDGEAGDGQWGSALNWVADRLPAASEEVVLDNSLVATSYIVSLDPGNVAVSVRSLLISPAPFQNITLLNPVTNVSPVAFVATGPGDAVILDAGAIFTNSSGAASGTPVSVGEDNFFRINNGGTYIHNTERGHTNGLIMRLSGAPGTEDGIFEFDVPGPGAYTISASGRTYGHLLFSAAASGGHKTYTAAGTSPFTINGDLEIRLNATLSYGANTNILLIKKDCLVHPGATFNLANGSSGSSVQLQGNLRNEGLITETGSSTTSKLEFNGTGRQLVSSTGMISQAITVVINNTAGAQLASPVQLPYSLVLINGKIRADQANRLILSDNATCTGGSPASFVEGPMEKIGDDDFVFPVGQGAMYAPIGISGGNGAGAADEFTAEYIRANPQSLHGANTDPFLDHVSYVEYWKLVRQSGLASKAISLVAHPYSFVRNFATIYASLYAGQWTHLGKDAALQGPSAPPYETGSITSEVTDIFGDFTLATTDNTLTNPLPVGILSFNAEKISNEATGLRWQLAAGHPAPAVFEIQRAIERGDFRTIASLPARENVWEYAYPDREPVAGRKYYRLKMTDTDGMVHLSKIATILVDAPQRLSLDGGSWADDQFLLRVSSSGARRVEILLIDLGGGIVRHRQLILMDGQHEYRLPGQGLARGIYLVTVLADDERTNTLKCFKQ